MALHTLAGTGTGDQGVIWLSAVPVKEATSNGDLQIVCKQENGETDEMEGTAGHPDIRGSLKKAILERRTAAGFNTDLADLNLWEDRTRGSSDEMTEEEKTRRECRRENNRRAARKCRLKQRDCRSNIEQELFVERHKRKQLLLEVVSLEKERQQLMAIWRRCSQSEDHTRPEDTSRVTIVGQSQQQACTPSQDTTTPTTHTNGRANQNKTITQLPVACVDAKHSDTNTDISVSLPITFMSDAKNLDIKPNCTMQLPLSYDTTMGTALKTQPKGESYNKSRMKSNSKYSSGIVVTGETALCYPTLPLDSSMDGYSEMMYADNIDNHGNRNDNSTNMNLNNKHMYSANESCMPQGDGKNATSSANGDEGDSDLEEIDMDEEKPLVIDLTI